MHGRASAIVSSFNGGIGDVRDVDCGRLVRAAVGETIELVYDDGVPDCFHLDVLECYA